MPRRRRRRAWRWRRSQGLLECGARVTVVAPEVTPSCSSCRSSGCRAATAGDLAAASSSSPRRPRRALNRRVFADAEARHCSATSSTCPSSARFILPAVHRAASRSQWPSRPAAPRPRSRSGSATTWPRRRPASTPSWPSGCATLRPWAKENLPTYEARRDYFRELVEEALGVSVASSAPGPAIRG